MPEYLRKRFGGKEYIFKIRFLVPSVIYVQTRDGFGPNFCGPGPIWADLLWAGPRLGPFLELDLWAWAGPGLSSFGLGWALGQIENQCWAKFGPF